jgi:hypothetical protein
MSQDASAKQCSCTTMRTSSLRSCRSRLPASSRGVLSMRCSLAASRCVGAAASVAVIPGTVVASRLSGSQLFRGFASRVPSPSSSLFSSSLVSSLVASASSSSWAALSLSGSHPHHSRQMSSLGHGRRAFHASTRPLARKRDHYEVLGVGKSAEKGEIKKAFYKLAKKYHPDQVSACVCECVCVFASQ